MIFSILFTSIAQAGTIVTFAEDPFPPYTIGKTGKKPEGGIAVKVIEKIFEKIPNTEPEFILLPWKRALNQVEQGNIDALMHLVKTKEREKKYIYTESIYNANSVIIFNNKHYPSGITWNTLEDLKHYRICINDGYAIHDLLKVKNSESQGDKFKIESASEIKDCFLQLKHKKADIHINDQSHAIAFFGKRGLLNQYTISSKPLYSRKIHIAFSRKSPAHKLIPKINKIISHLKAHGIIEKVIYAHHKNYLNGRKK